MADDSERKGGATGGDRASDLYKGALGRDSNAKKELYRPEATKALGSPSGYRPKIEPYVPRSGATSVERADRGFNPAWLLVPAAGLLVGGLGIASLHKEQDVKVGPAANAAAPAAATTAKVMADCKITFSKTTIGKPVSRLKNIATGMYLDPAAGRRFVVVNTMASNTGHAACWATTRNQRGYTGSTSYTTGNVIAGSQLYRGRRMAKSIGVDRTIQGAYVFQIPTGKIVSSVRLRSNGSRTWTTVKAG